MAEMICIMVCAPTATRELCTVAEASLVHSYILALYLRRHKLLNSVHLA